jgi:hypothetical protein
LIIVSTVGSAAGARFVAAALACSRAEPDGAALLVDLGGRRPRAAVLAAGPARGLEERLAAHMPDAAVVSRGRLCHLVLPGDGLDGVGPALAIGRGAAPVVLLPPTVVQVALDDPALRPGGAVLRADVRADRALTGLAVGDLLDRGIPAAVVKRPLGWVAARRAMAGILPAGAGPVVRPLGARLHEGGRR